jgi:hypothetical protein
MAHMKPKGRAKKTCDRIHGSLHRTNFTEITRLFYNFLARTAYSPSHYEM